MKKASRSDLTREQQALYDRFINDPSSIQGELPSAVLHALDRELRPIEPRKHFGGVSVGKAEAPSEALLTGIDAATFLGVNINTFARRVEPELTPVPGRRHRLYRRSDLVAWQARESQRKPKR